MTVMRKSKKFIITAAVIIGVIIFGYWRWQNNQSDSAVQLSTSKVERGTLVVTVEASGQASSSNNASISTQASGVVKEVYVENGETVTSGQKIAELELDLDGKLRSAQAWSSYQSAKNNLESQKATMYSLNSSMWLANQKFINNSVVRSLPVEDPTHIQESSDWLAAEAKYKNQANVVAQSQTALSAAWLSYQQSSLIIYAPITGTVTGLSLQPGTVLLAQSTTTGSASSQKIASIKTDAPAQISVNLSEIDVTKVSIGDSVTVVLDAFSGKAFTGKVISVDTIGSSSSGVTTYPAVIALDTEAPEILPNMSATASIITAIKENDLLIPSTAIQSQNNGTTVKVVNHGKTESVTVEIGESSDSLIEIVSGLNEGDEVVTNPAVSTNAAAGQTKSVFSSFGGTMRLR